MENNLNSVQHESGTPQRWRVLVATFISYFYESYDIVILSIAMPVIINVLDITLAQGGLLATSTMIGAMVGSVVIGVIAENRGRKFALILCLLLFGLTTLPVIIIQHYQSWLILRFFCGMGLGGIWGPCVALVSMHWKAKYRARATSFMLSTFGLAAITAAFVGRLVLQVDWRILFLLGGTAIFMCVVAHFMIPPDRVKINDAEKKEGESETLNKEKIGVGVLFQGDVAKLTICGTLFQVANMGGYWGATAWIPTYLIKDVGLDTTLMANFMMLLYLGMFLGYQGWAFLADRIGRKKTIILCFLFDAVSIGIYLILPESILFGWGAVVGFGFGGIFGVQGVYYAELFPERIRALAGGFCFNVGRLGSVLAPFTIGLIGDNYGLKVGLSIVPFVFVVGLIAVAFLPETMKKKGDI